MKVISSQSIISKISRTYRPTDSSWINEAIENIGWAIQAIGYHANFIIKSTEPPYISVNNHRGKIPCDVERVIHVESLQIERSSLNILNPDGTTPFPQPDQFQDDCNYKGIKMSLASDTSLPSEDENTPRTTAMNTSPLENSYWINGDYIVTGFEKGLIKIHGVHFNIDKKGMPNVVDEFNYKTCCEYYCLAQIIAGGFKHPELNYATCFALFEKFRDKAENACKMLSLDRADRLEKSWNRYARSIDFGANFYAGLNNQEYISTR